ncbi:MAG: hypothetical protein AAF629_11060, partial [Chloroflexota bacterium]
MNHNYNDQAIKLAKGLRPYADVLTLDSGSQLAPHQQAFFDIQLPNVYYSGLVNAAYEALQKRTTHTILYFICSTFCVSKNDMKLSGAKHGGNQLQCSSTGYHFCQFEHEPSCPGCVV